MTKELTRPLTRGKILPRILNFSLPIFAGYLFQQFYNIVDTIIVGRILGVRALAAVGSTASLNYLIIGFCIGLCSGFAIPAAHSYGAGDHKTMRQYIFNSEVLSLIFAILITSITLAFCRPLLALMRTPDDITERAYRYISIIFGGIPFILLFNMVSCVLRSIGDSKTPLVFLIISSVLNIILDLVFILACRLDVAGAALATIISQGLSALACLIYIKREFEILKIEKEERIIRLSYIGRLCLAGVPMGLECSITALGAVILQTATNSLGSAIVAAVSAATKVQLFFSAPLDALGTAMATFAGQNAGAGKWKRLRTGVKSSSLMGLIYGAFFWNHGNGGKEHNGCGCRSCLGIYSGMPVLSCRLDTGGTVSSTGFLLWIETA
ncbi:MAG: MATE family efflux transporter [Spirochaetales bacterium]|nr:MATE family efflux transporter [Spirochaetales bacterium]